MKQAKLTKKTRVNAAITAAVFSTILLSPTSMASTDELDEQISTNETIGISAGAIVGGIFAGPVGAIVGALTGDFFAKNVDYEEQVVKLESELSNKDLYAKNQHNKHQAEIKRLEQQYQQEVMTIASTYENSEKAQVENILVSLMFRTGSSQIEPHYQQQVEALAQVLKRSPHLNIDLSGYTDKQGDEELNNKLAKERVANVKQILVAQGIAEGRIIENAFGELEPIDNTLTSEVNYFDRRVELKLLVNSEEVAKQANL
ncbi:sortase-associated OmpA-like protein PdsO [Thalassomonas sp. M1454]|uniref:sortase-associated OmpA-like protein PdsO n=1 Tax=Thalassomonas sp. M1454 TaxID=2594477 RepID=UPI00117E6794|nr:sortase-associated OmpA-like protein PdsO [Thalassomonas sp. M1454]TRX53847.1 sortase-associated OmpA-like protein PdsO [Thalassomonas sp. M1454]